MRNYEFQKQLKALYDKAVERYGRGERDANAFFDRSETDFLAGIGAAPIELYDFAEDFCCEGEPDWETCLLIQTIRRDYFLQEQGGKPTGVTIPEPEFPAREAEADGIPWLPRLILKARSKLKGEMPSDLMYCCGGDRNFFKQHDLHPAEVLHMTWRNPDDDRAIVEWVLARKNFGF